MDAVARELFENIDWSQVSDDPQVVNQKKKEILDGIRRIYTEPQAVVTSSPWEANKTIWAGEISGKLHKHYPNYNWAAGWTTDGSCAIVDCLDIPSPYRLIIRFEDIDMPELKGVIRMAGEMLERYNLSRTKANQAELSEMPLVGGYAIPDKTAIPKSNLA